MESLDIARQILLALAPFASNGTLTTSGAGPSDPAPQLAQRAWSLLTANAQNNPRLTVALEIFQAEPDDQRNLERLAQQLADHLHQQTLGELRAIIGQLQQHARQAQPQVNVSNTGENAGQQVGINTGQMAQQVDQKTDITLGDRISTGRHQRQRDCDRRRCLV